MTSPMVGKGEFECNFANTALSVEELACLIVYEEDYSAQCAEKTNAP